MIISIEVQYDTDKKQWTVQQGSLIYSANCGEEFGVQIVQITKELLKEQQIGIARALQSLLGEL